VCLFEQDDGSNTQFKHEEIPVDPEACNNVDTLVENIMDELEVEETNG